MSINLKPLDQRESQRRGRDPPAAAAGCAQVDGHQALHAAGAEHHRRRPRQPHAVPVHARGSGPGRAERLDQPVSSRSCKQLPRAGRRRHRPADRRPGRVAGRSTASPRRASASRPSTIDNTLYDAFGQRQINTMYTQLNQYHVILEAQPALPDGSGQAEQALHPGQRRRSGASRRRPPALPSAASARPRPARTPPPSRLSTRPSLRSAHAAGKTAALDQRPPGAKLRRTPPTSSSFQQRRPARRVRPRFDIGHRAALDQSPGPVPLGDRLVQPGAAMPRWASAITAIDKAAKDLNFPPSVQADFQGTAAAFENSLSNEALLILAALVTVYIVLGVLYESFIHPITILSTLPSAGVGALLALMLFRQDLSVVAHHRHHPADRHREEERHHDGRLRARGRARARHELDRRDLRGLPAALPPHHDDHHGRAAGRHSAGLRHRASARNCAARSASPWSAVCCCSQVLTLYTTPVIYIFFDNLAQRFSRAQAAVTAASPEPSRQATHEPLRPVHSPARWPPRC